MHDPFCHKETLFVYYEPACKKTNWKNNIKQCKVNYSYATESCTKISCSRQTFEIEHNGRLL